MEGVPLTRDVWQWLKGINTELKIDALIVVQ
jgi:hypothetical protein